MRQNTITQLASLGVICISLLLSAPAQAQCCSNRGGQSQQAQSGGQCGQSEERQEARVDQMKDQLNLTEEQQAQLAELYKEQHESRRENAEEARAHRQATQNKIQEILTEEQLEKWYELRGEKSCCKNGGAEKKCDQPREEATGGMEDQRRAHFNRMVEELELTAEQQAQVKEIMESNRPEAGGHPSPEHHRAVMEKIEAILTPEQKEKWEEVRRELRPRHH